MTRVTFILLVRLCLLAGVSAWLSRSGLESLVLPALFMPPSLLGGGGNTVPCNKCEGGTVSNALQVMVSGLTTNACTDCPALSGTYVLDTYTEGSACVWYLAIGPYCTGNSSTQINYISAQLNNSTIPNFFVTFVNSSSGVGQIFWGVASNLSIPHDCTAFPSLIYQGLPDGFFGGFCNGSGSSCSVTVL